MRSYEAASVIAATPHAAWGILVDGAEWPSWDSCVNALEEKIAPGQKITIRSLLEAGG